MGIVEKARPALSPPRGTGPPPGPSCGLSAHSPASSSLTARPRAAVACFTLLQMEEIKRAHPPSNPFSRFIRALTSSGPTLGAHSSRNVEDAEEQGDRVPSWYA